MLLRGNRSINLAYALPGNRPTLKPPTGNELSPGQPRSSTKPCGGSALRDLSKELSFLAARGPEFDGLFRRLIDLFGR
jgi:hypothetical protein